LYGSGWFGSLRLVYGLHVDGAWVYFEIPVGLLCWLG
jgi:hypothetical protein